MANFQQNSLPSNSKRDSNSFTSSMQPSLMAYHVNSELDQPTKSKDAMRRAEIKLLEDSFVKAAVNHKR
tara:strand:+ start:596 stop:802 length:207 start_codon:yes stop_codon:yes gene_type:complete